VSKPNLLNKRDLIAYFLVAGTGALVQIICGSIFSDYMRHEWAWSLAYFVSFIVGFVLTKMFAFNARNTQKTRREMVKFLMVSALSWLITVGGAVLCLRILRSNFGDTLAPSPLNNRSFNLTELFAQLTGMGFSFMSNYILHKTFTFKSTGFYDRLKSAIKLRP
jgi:putative flippase GtrA